MTFGFGEGNDLRATAVACDFGGVSFPLDGRTIRVPLLGRHAAANALAAVAVARRLGVPEDAIVAGLAEASGPEMRLDLSEINGVKILNDAYNANPASVAAALETLRDLPHDGRKIAVLGDMLELGPEQRPLSPRGGRTRRRVRVRPDRLRRPRRPPYRRRRRLATPCASRRRIGRRGR